MSTAIADFRNVFAQAALAITAMSSFALAGCDGITSSFRFCGDTQLELFGPLENPLDLTLDGAPDVNALWVVGTGGFAEVSRGAIPNEGSLATPEGCVRGESLESSYVLQIFAPPPLERVTFYDGVVAFAVLFASQQFFDSGDTDPIPGVAPILVYVAADDVPASASDALPAGLVPGFNIVAPSSEGVACMLETEAARDVCTLEHACGSRDQDPSEADAADSGAFYRCTDAACPEIPAALAACAFDHRVVSPVEPVSLIVRPSGASVVP